MRAFSTLAHFARPSEHRRPSWPPLDLTADRRTRETGGSTYKDDASPNLFVRKRVSASHETSTARPRPHRTRPRSPAGRAAGAPARRQDEARRGGGAPARAARSEERRV